VDQAVEEQFRARFERLRSVGMVARRSGGKNAIKEHKTVAALILDALAHHLTGALEPNVIKLDHNWLSKGPIEVVARNRTVNDRVYDLAEAGWLKVNRSAHLGNHIVTTFCPGPALLLAAEIHGVTLSDIGVDAAPGDVELRGTKPPGEGAHRSVMSFPETEQTREIARRLAELNECLQQADLRSHLGRPLVVDVRRRRVSRAFLDGSFERGGRLAGTAFWLSLRKVIRREALLIDGERIAEVDLRAAMPSIAYALEGAEVSHDPYTLEIPRDIPRDAVKLVLMQMLWTPITRHSRLPKEAREAAPDHYVASQVFDFIRRHNAPIAKRLGQSASCGAELMWHESEIIIEATLRCFEAGFSALPLHDALLVAASRAEEAAAVLKEVFKARLGIQPAVKVEVFAGSPGESAAGA
jgi:hypothetical protein